MGEGPRRRGQCTGRLRGDEINAVLANALNLIPPERVFSILNDTFDDDQESAMPDYIELSLQLQYNERSRRAE